MSDEGKALHSLIEIACLLCFPRNVNQVRFGKHLGDIATFGFLEDTLARAIFAYTAIQEYP